NGGGAEQGLVGTYKVGGDFYDAPVISGMSLLSDDKKYIFTYTIINPASGIIFYSAQSTIPEGVPVKQPEPDKKPSTPALKIREVKPFIGYPGAGVGNLIGNLIKRLTGWQINVPDPVPGFDPIPVSPAVPVTTKIPTL